MCYQKGEALNEPKEKGPVAAFGGSYGGRYGSDDHVFGLGRNSPGGCSC